MHLGQMLGDEPQCKQFLSISSGRTFSQAAAVTQSVRRDHASSGLTFIRGK